MRDRLKNSDFFTKGISEMDAIIARFSKSVHENPDNFEVTMRRAFHLNMQYQEKIMAMYSRGDAIAEITPIYLQFLDNFEFLVDLAHQDIGYIREEWVQTLDEYYRLVSWAVLFDVDVPRRREFVEDLDFFGQQKTGDIMLAKAGLVEREPIERLGGKPAFEPLLEALEADSPGLQEVRLRTFLDNWYPAMKKMNVAWIDNHKSKHDVYFGYWCFEAAAAVKVLGLDDTPFKNHPHYPYDLAHAP